jgi:hypothetical protein
VEEWETARESQRVGEAGEMWGKRRSPQGRRGELGRKVGGRRGSQSSESMSSRLLLVFAGYRVNEGVVSEEELLCDRRQLAVAVHGCSHRIGPWNEQSKE